MKVFQVSETFRPVTLVLETEDEFDKLMAIIGAVADNSIHHTQQVIRAAVDFKAALIQVELP